MTTGSIEIKSFTDCAQLQTLGEAWDRLSEQELKFVPGYAQLRRQLAAKDCKFQFLVALEDGRPIAVACFVYRDTRKSYEVASRRLLSLPVKDVILHAACMPGHPTEDIVRRFLQIIIKNRDFDLITLGEIFVDSPLYSVATHLDHGHIAWQVARKTRLWWLIRLPDTFSEYVAALRPTAAKHIMRDFRRFEKEGPEYRIFKRPEEVDSFLRDAEAISKLTYQWKIGDRLCNNETTRKRLTRLAEDGTLRCYISYLHGRPCAFGFGELSHRAFGFHQTGYDPQYRKLSPGTALILTMIRDLIENTDAQTFDFLWGGDDGYKARFGNISLSCAPIQIAPIYRPYCLLIFALDQALNAPKKLAGRIIEHGAIKHRLKATLRRVGVGTF